jgi:hypothetical protein
MEISGKIIEVLPLQEGQSSNGNWKKQAFILETEGQYPRMVCVDRWGDKVDNPKLVVGDKINAYIEIASREWNGKWFTDVKAWKVEIFIGETDIEGGSLGGMIPKKLEESDWNDAEGDNVLPF